MHAFLQRHCHAVTGMLSGFDRLRFRGSLRMLSHKGGFASFLRIVGVKLAEFGQWVEQTTAGIRQATERVTREAGRPLQYVSNPRASKEEIARRIAAADGIEQGLICVLSCVEPCFSYSVFGRGSPQLRAGMRRCLHYYHYLIDPYFGFMHVRVQSWMPMAMHVCVNGREWLARRMDQASLGYRRAENCFTALEDPQAAQALFDQMQQTDWPGQLNRLAEAANPFYRTALGSCRQEYYWSTEESEWASDVMFQNPQLLGQIYPSLIRHGVLNMASRDVLRFLGRKAIDGQKFNGKLRAEVSTDLRQRIEGVRIKHRVASNSIKMYDKQGSVLRVETTINKPRDMKVYRPREGDEQGKKDWRYLRKGVADLWRRGELCQAANERYLQSMASASDPASLGKLCQSLCQPTRWQSGKAKASMARGLNPLAPEDGALLEAVGRGEFTLSGFRNRQLRELLYNDKPCDAVESRRRSGATTRKIRLLRAHGLIRKVPRSHRYMVSEAGRVQITALLAARAADAAKLAA
jgi:hypothetical protein